MQKSLGIILFDVLSDALSLRLSLCNNAGPNDGSRLDFGCR